LGVSNYSTLVALPGSSSKGDYSKVYYTNNKDKVNEAYYKDDKWSNTGINNS